MEFKYFQVTSTSFKLNHFLRDPFAIIPNRIEREFRQIKKFVLLKKMNKSLQHVYLIFVVEQKLVELLLYKSLGCVYVKQDIFGACKYKQEKLVRFDFPICKRRLSVIIIDSIRYYLFSM